MIPASAPAPLPASASAPFAEPSRPTARAYALLALVALALLLPGRMRLPPMDRDESRYLQATSQMLQTGDLVDIRFQDQPRHLQPAGIYWLEAASVRLLGHPDRAWPYRVPSLLAAVASVLLTARIGAALFGARAGIVAGGLLACSVLLGVEGRLAKIDATLLAAVLCAQSALLRLFLDREAGRPSAARSAACYWAALGCGLMLKGPVILLPCWGTLLGLAVVERRVDWWRRLRPAWGLPLMLAIVLPWCAAIALRTDGQFFGRAVGHNLLGKVANGQEAHGQPPGFHALAFLPGFWPGSLLAVPMLAFAWRGRRMPAVRFLCAWIVPGWAVFELIATKLPHYALPFYPALACLAAAAPTSPSRPGWGWRWAGRCWAGAWLAVTAALALAGPVLLWRLRPAPQAPVPWGLVAGSALCGLGMLAAALACLRLLPRRPDAALAAGLAAAVLLVGDAYGLVLPRLDAVGLSPRIARAVARARPCPDSVLSSASYSEPSLVFLVGRSTRLVGAAAAAADLARDPVCAMALVGRRDLPAFARGMAAAGRTPRALAEIEGINYSTGRQLDLLLFDARGNTP